jgi:hypothetical protein
MTFRTKHLHHLDHRHRLGGWSCARAAHRMRRGRSTVSLRTAHEVGAPLEQLRRRYETTARQPLPTPFSLSDGFAEVVLREGQ